MSRDEASCSFASIASTRTNQIRTISKTRIGRVIGRIGREESDGLDAALAIQLGLAD